MSKFEVKQRIFALGSKFDIKEIGGDKRYLVQADLFDIGKNINVYNESNKKVLYMEQVIRLGAHKYKIYDKNGIELGMIEKELLVPEYDCTENLEGIKMKANDILARHYTVYNKGREIGSLGKNISIVRDEYYLNVEDEEYTELLIGFLIMIDMIKFNNKN